MKGILTRNEDGIWVVKWSDLHSFGYETHWPFTELSTESNSIRYLKDNLVRYKPLEEGVEVEFEMVTSGYHETNLTPIYSAKLIFPEVDEFEKEEPNKTHYLDELPNMDKNVLAKMWADAMPKYPIGGYAPGLYSCVCVSCEKEFMGDKRAVQCEPCAIEMVNTKITINDKRGIETVKKETLEEVIEREGYPKGITQEIWEDGVRLGAKWQQDKMYSEEEVLELLQKALTHKDNGETGNLITAQGKIRTANFYSWFEQFKKK
jgi:hypothetical protein